VSVTRAGEKWYRAGKVLEPASIQSFVDKLRDLSATKFAATGFGAATVNITVVSADGKKTEKVALSRAGADWVARREGEPALYVVRAATVDELEKSVADLKDESRPPAKK
jgi:hypothetical protein